MSLAHRLASQSTVIFAARLCGAGLIFAAQALMARWWGANLLGEFLIVVASVNLIAVTMPLGFHTVGTYFASEYRAHGDRRQLIAFLARAYGHVVIVFAAVMVVGPTILEAVGQGAGILARHFVPVALVTLATATVYINSALLVGFKRPFAGFFADTLLRPMIVLASFALVALHGTPAVDFSTMLWLMGWGYVGVALVQFGLVVASLRHIEDRAAVRAAESGRWWRFALPWSLISIATDFFFDIDLLLLANSLSHKELAIFGVCTRIFSLAAFGVSAVYAVTLPEIFESDAKADRAMFNRKIGQANAIASLTAVALFLVLLLIAPFALMLFGPGFAAGATPLAILCLCLVVRSVLGPASIVLSIHDRPWASLPAIGLGLVVLLIGNWLLVPPLGLTGAALSALVAITIWSLGLWWTALRTAGIDVSILQWFRRPIVLT